MDKEVYDRLFKMSVDELNAERARAWDRWTWDSGSIEDKNLIRDIDTMLKARARLGLMGAEKSNSGS